MNTKTRIPLATGYTLHVFVNKDMRPCRVPEEIKEVVKECVLLKKRCRCK
jgi:acyl-CoA thioesterase FadM